MWFNFIQICVINLNDTRIFDMNDQLEKSIEMVNHKHVVVIVVLKCSNCTCVCHQNTDKSELNN